MNKAIGSSNSVADVIEDLRKCPQCGAATQLNHGTCINCFLREGLEAKGEASREAFESILAEADVPDKEWRLGHYEILEEIGRGGMGVIYRARQQHSRRIVAVKRIPAHQVDSRETLVRFRREAEAVASLDHPNILPIYEVGESEERLPFFSMKYATGGSLRTAAPKLRNDPRDCVRVMAKVARAIAYAHSKGVLHRDLQPGNILLDENGEPMVSDFGLAKWLNETSDLTRTLETLGTPGYIAPEQTECRAVDLTSAADIYSLGAILFYLLTGRSPFVGPNVLYVIHQAAATPAPRLRSLAPSLDRDLETIVAHCLESDPDARYQSARALADDLEHWRRHEPIRARRTGVFTRGRKWVRRNPTSTLLVAALVVLAAAMVGVMVWKSESIHPSGIPAKSIAVLPFDNLSVDPANAFLTDGVQDEILNDLARIADLKVISRTSVMQYKSGARRNLRKIAKELGVTHLVEGTVQRAESRVRVSAQLIDARTDTRVWGERYDRDLADVFALESELAEKIVFQLKGKLSPEEKSAMTQKPTSDLMAYDLYLRARNLLGTSIYARIEPSHFEALDLLNQAIARDPNFFLAYCQLARVHDEIYYFGIDHTPHRLVRAEEAIRNAARLRPDAGETHLARAKHLYHGYLDFAGARREIALARTTLPNEPSVSALAGFIDRRQSRWDQSLHHLERAAELDPFNVYFLQQLSGSYQKLRRFPDALKVMDRTLAVVPDDSGAQMHRASLAFEWRADTKPYHAAIGAILNSNPDEAPSIAHEWLHLALCERDFPAAERALAAIPPDGGHDEGFVFPRYWYAGVIARARGDSEGVRGAFSQARAELQEIVTKQPEYGEPMSLLAVADAGLGRKEEAIREGRRAVELLPITKDSLNGAFALEFLAVVYAWTNEKDLALEQLDLVSKTPGDLSYSRLRLHPFWDPLRGDPRFEKLVEEVKKSVALK
jgi:TolB-like protein/tRNA A-37 threonylcarbamoyl transferase component Bud32/Tfp pilus assembly protein PilF